MTRVAGSSLGWPLLEQLLGFIFINNELFLIIYYIFLTGARGRGAAGTALTRKTGGEAPNPLWLPASPQVPFPGQAEHSRARVAEIN